MCSRKSGDSNANRMSHECSEVVEETTNFGEYLNENLGATTAQSSKERIADSEGLDVLNTDGIADSETPMVETTHVCKRKANRVKEKDIITNIKSTNAGPTLTKSSQNKEIGENADTKNRKPQEEESRDNAVLKGHKDDSSLKHDMPNCVNNQKAESRLLDHHYFRCAPPISRLGNMMFQLAATLGIAHSLRYKPFIEPYHPLTHSFETGLVADVRVRNEMVLSEEQCIAQVWKYDKRWRTFNLTTWGYLQSWKYFQNNTDEVRTAFTIRRTFLHEALKFLSYHTKSDDILIGLHVRRGDFTVKGTADLGFATASVHYIRKAMDFYREFYDRPVFVVVSDDIPWCRENIKGSDVIYSPFMEPIIDMAILTSCDHSIITGGSFGWWGAWLAGGKVVYLKDYPTPGSWLETQIQDYYPKHWIGMSNGPE